MSKLLFQAMELVKYQLTAKSLQKIHPPFVYKLYTFLSKERISKSDEKAIKSIKKHAARNKNIIEHVDMGAKAGSNGLTRGHLKRIGKIASNNGIRHKYGRILYLITKHFKPRTILELGTSLGLSTLYLAKACKDCKVYTIEGCAETAAVADKYFRKAHLENTEILTGGFKKTLPLVYEKYAIPDLIFVDGNHKYQPTIEYFHLIKSYAQEDTIIIFDDIHWSREMKKAWKEIIADPDITLSIDLFQLGIVFFKKGLTKQNFVLRY